MKDATQDNNCIILSTPLGKDALILTGFDYHEEISGLFSLKAQAFANGVFINREGLIGSNVSVALKYNIGKQLLTRYFNGIVVQIDCVGSRMPDKAESELYQDYILTIRPDFYLASFKCHYKIYQDKNVEEILGDVLGRHGISFRDDRSKTYPIYGYKVQYHESDLDFVLRLLQDEGIFFFFEHSQDSHQLIIADSVDAYAECEDGNVRHVTGSCNDPHVHHWTTGLQLAAGQSAISGFDLQSPMNPPSAMHSHYSQGINPPESELYQYQGESGFNPRVNFSSGNILEALQRDTFACSGSSNCRSFSAGKTFTFIDHEDPAQIGKSYVFTQLHLHVSIQSQTGALKNTHQIIHNQFSCVPNTVAYRPHNIVTKPKVYGVQTATVSGKEGEEVYLDPLGRVKVKFHWDRDGQNNEFSSCWIRVAQAWAGAGWGCFFTPRVGQEVLIDFINGDPEQPIICGSLYNASQLPPYSQGAINGIKTRSLDGKGSNYSEIRFDDTKGSEKLAFHAEKDHCVVVENDHLEVVENNHQLSVKNDRTITVENNQKIVVNNNRNIDVKNDQTCKAGQKIVIEAGQEIVLKTGSASITMSSGGDISIKGSNIKINGQAITLKAGKIALN
ncbi:type VI secretion system tip protein VgrG [Photobacterium profundum]|uniref:Uncharacterized protein n=1 Tax=Photobacterium profundum (strain SS9) TaxID=298386 RepID=Q6LUC9_PHOPR|nr:type VI secretion system tip protein VgrG [Photobacterium profundum]CAG19096.1 hypothetical protein PBPRA0675 [Photobacterium profundum SS9]